MFTLHLIEIVCSFAGLGGLLDWEFDTFLVELGSKFSNRCIKSNWCRFTDLSAPENNLLALGGLALVLINSGFYAQLLQ